MRSVGRELGFAFLSWLLPFGIALCIFPLKKSYPPLFESLMAVALAGSTALLGYLYLRKTRGRPLAQGAKIGALWIVANWLLDAPMFSAGPMKMSFAQYAMDIGVAYLMIPVITVALGAMAEASSAR